MEQLLHYSPIIVAIMVFLIQQRIVVTPEQLEKKHREILKDVEEKFGGKRYFFEKVEKYWIFFRFYAVFQVAYIIIICILGAKLQQNTRRTKKSLHFFVKHDLYD